MSKHIGIAAVSPEGAALFYRQVNRQAAALMPPRSQPRVTLHAEPIQLYLDALRDSNWHEVGRLLRRSAELLARCGAEVCITPDNVVQHAIPIAEVGSPIPWLAMTELVAKAVEADKRKAVGLIGTKMVTSGSAYQTHLGLRGVRVIAPTPEDSDAIEGIIFSELLYGIIRPESRSRVRAVIDHLAAAGCEAVILASSEVPLLVSADDSALPIYDAADILAQGVIRAAG